MGQQAIFENASHFGLVLDALEFQVDCGCFLDAARRTYKVLTTSTPIVLHFTSVRVWQDSVARDISIGKTRSLRKIVGTMKGQQTGEFVFEARGS